MELYERICSNIGASGLSNGGGKMKNKKFYIQPDVPTSITCWSFTGMIFLFSMLLWLEITVFQVWTLITLIIFLIVTFIEIKGRYIIVDSQKIYYHALIVFNSQEIERSKVKDVEVNKWGVIKIKTTDRDYEFLTMPKVARKLNVRLENE